MSGDHGLTSSASTYTHASNSCSAPACSGGHLYGSNPVQLSRYFLGSRVDGYLGKSEVGAQMARRNGPVELQVKDITIQTYGTNKYGRTLADVLLQDSTNVNHELVKEGWCWWYRKYAPGDTVLEELEKPAREERKGLWADPHPVPPWEWRKRK